MQIMTKNHGKVLIVKQHKKEELLFGQSYQRIYEKIKPWTSIYLAQGLEAVTCFGQT